MLTEHGADLCQIETATDHHALQTFEEWLQSFKGLQYIYCDIGNTAETLKPLAIKTHADSLRSLFIRFGSGGNTTAKYTPSAVEELCERCTKLRQLSLPLPELEARCGKPFDTEDVQRQIVSCFMTRTSCCY